MCVTQRLARTTRRPRLCTSSWVGASLSAALGLPHPRSPGTRRCRSTSPCGCPSVRQQGPGCHPSLPLPIPSSGVTFRNRSAALLRTLWCPPQSIGGARHLRPGGSPWRPLRWPGAPLPRHARALIWSPAVSPHPCSGLGPLSRCRDRPPQSPPALPAPLESAPPGVGGPRLRVALLGAARRRQGTRVAPLPVLVPAGRATRVSATVTEGCVHRWYTCDFTLENARRLFLLPFT